MRQQSGVFVITTIIIKARRVAPYVRSGSHYNENLLFTVMTVA